MDFKNLKDIDLSTKEGRGFFSALCILTQSPNLTIKGEEINGAQIHPDDMLHKVEAAAREIWPDWYEKSDKEQSLGGELRSLLNRYSRENESNTPDFILAEYLMSCLKAFETASLAREKWFGKSLHP